VDAIEIHASHPLQRTQRVGHPDLGCLVRQGLGRL
jgi:hypothetical protein